MHYIMNRIVFYRMRPLNDFMHGCSAEFAVMPAVTRFGRAALNRDLNKAC